MLEAKKGMGRGQGRERRRRNAIQETRVAMVSNAGEEDAKRAESEADEMHANAGRKEHACW